MAREIVNPRWSGQDKTTIVAQFKYDDGRVLTASISNAGDAADNPDWKEIMETFGEETLTKNLERSLDARNERRVRTLEQRNADRERMKKESLFNAKAEAFDIDLVKNSKNRDVKNKIRRATSITEVLVFTAMLHMLEHPLATGTDPAVDATNEPSA